MVNLTFFGSKLSSSPRSPLMWILQFSFIRFLNDLPLNTYKSFYCRSLVLVTPEWDGEEKRRQGEETQAKMYLLGCTIAFLSPASIMGYEWENCLGGLIGERKELKLPSCFSFLTQIISVGARMVVVDGAGNKHTMQCLLPVGKDEWKQPTKSRSLNRWMTMLHWPLSGKKMTWPQQEDLSPSLESRFK